MYEHLLNSPRIEIPAWGDKQGADWLGVELDGHYTIKLDAIV
jgi:hypothetical protein